MERAHQPPARWNRAEVSHYLVPFLSLGDALRAEHEANDAPGESDLKLLTRTAAEALHACPTAYRQLLRVYQSADDKTYGLWFGGIDCDDELLAAAFTLIERALSQQLPTMRRTSAPPDLTEQQPSPATSAPHAPQDAESARRVEQLTEDAALRRLFCVSHLYTDENGRSRVRRTDLLVPFLELCRTTDAARRHQLAERCRTAVLTHLDDYVHALAYYRESYAAPDTPPHAALLPETHACMQYIEETLARCDYETALSEKKAALEYERGGLGWFGRARKREIDAALYELSLTELQLRIEDERTRLQVACEPLERDLTRMETELERAPLTAFTRKRELRAAIKQTQAALADLRTQSELESLTEQLSRLERKKRR